MSAKRINHPPLDVSSQVLEDQRHANMPSPEELTNSPGDIIRRLFSPRQFQHGVDTAFKEIFKIDNRRPDGRAYMLGICPVDPDTKLFMYTMDGDSERIYRGVVDEGVVESWYTSIKDRFPNKLAHLKVGDRTRIIAVDRTTDEIDEIIRAESSSSFAHEAQHLTWELLTKRQKESAMQEIKNRLPDYDARKNRVGQMYAGLENPVRDHLLDELTCDEIMSETRRLVHLQITNSPLGYFESGVKGFTDLVPVIPVMDEITRNYARQKSIPSPDDAFDSLGHGGRLWVLKRHDAAKSHVIFKIDQPEPYTLPRSIKILTND